MEHGNDPVLLWDGTCLAHKGLLWHSLCEVAVFVQVLLLFSLSLAAVSNRPITLSNGLFFLKTNHFPL